MPQPYFQNIHHTALTITDLTASLTFYQALGFAEEKSYTDEKITIKHLLLGSTRLEIFFYHTTKKTPANRQDTLSCKLQQPGWQHIALHTHNIRQALQWAIDKSLVQKSCKIIEGRTGVRYFFIQDPDQNFIEIVEEKTIK